MIELIIILKGMAIGWIITRFQPLQLLVEVIWERFRKNLFIQLIMIGLSCSKCASLWGSLILFRDPWLAIASSFLIVIYEKTLGNWEKQIEF